MRTIILPSIFLLLSSFSCGINEELATKDSTIDEFRVVFASILRIFAELDANADGQLTFPEWSTNVQTGFLGKIRFDEFDENLDGHLDREEFIQEHFRAALGPSIVLKFQEADLDKNGLLSQMELKQYQKQLDNSAILDKWDQNGDGQLDSREFVLHCYDKFLTGIEQLGQVVEQMELKEKEHLEPIEL